MYYCIYLYRKNINATFNNQTTEIYEAIIKDEP